MTIKALSPSTTAYDCGEKFALYPASLMEVAYVDVDTRCSDIYRRRADGL